MSDQQTNQSAPQTQFLGRKKKQNCCNLTCEEPEPKSCQEEQPIACGSIGPTNCGCCQKKLFVCTQETTSSSSTSCSSDESEQDPCKGRHRRRMKEKLSKPFTRKQKTDCCHQEDTPSTSCSESTVEECCTHKQEPACNYYHLTCAKNCCGGGVAFYDIRKCDLSDQSSTFASISSISSTESVCSDNAEVFCEFPNPSLSNSTECPSIYGSLTKVCPSSSNSQPSEYQIPSKSSTTTCTSTISASNSEFPKSSSSSTAACQTPNSKTSKSSTRSGVKSSTELAQITEQAVICPGSNKSSTSKCQSLSSKRPSSSNKDFCGCPASSNSEMEICKEQSSFRPGNKSSAPSRRC